MTATVTKLYCFPHAATENATELTIRMQNILHSPTIARYDVTYKLYRRQSEKLMTLQFGNTALLYCYCGTAVYELGSDLEAVLLKLKTWTLRQTMKIVGSVHELNRDGPGMVGKYQVSVGVISQGPSTKGILLALQEPLDGTLQVNDEQVLRDVMGLKFQTLMAPATAVTSMMLSTGASLSLQGVTPSGKLQTATAYFEMFSKL